MRHRTLIAKRARALRKSMSEPEVMLWSRLRGRGPERPTFRRQHPLGSMILDFYCPAVRLAVEVDGATHWEPEARARDAARDRWLQSQGITVMRIAASSVYANLGQVTEAILWKVEALRLRHVQEGLRPAPSTARSSAGGPPPAAAPRRGR